MNCSHAVVRFLAAVALTIPSLFCADSDATLRLPAPRLDSGRLLMQTLQERKTTRDFLDKPLSVEQLSGLLWAAFGVNRPAEGKRTAPSAWDQQEIDIYVFTSAGVYLYDAKQHLLRRVLAGDRRASTADTDFARQAPVSLVYVADFTKMAKAEPDKRLFYAAADTGFIGQNVYLYCASEGLGTVIHDGTDKPALGAALTLRPDQRIILAQAVGYPSR